MNEISKRIAYYMKLRKISYGELSNKTGIPKSALYRYAEGLTDKIPIDRIEIMAPILGVTPRDILGWNELTSEIDEKTALVNELTKDFLSLSLDDLQSAKQYLDFLKSKSSTQ